MTPRKKDAAMREPTVPAAAPKRGRAASPASPAKAAAPPVPMPEVQRREVHTTSECLGADPEGRALLVVFRLDSQRYGLPLARVQEIQQIVALAEIPDASSSVVGMVNLRGSMLPAIDLRTRLGLTAAPWGLQTPMVFCRASGGVVAFIVDEVEDVIEVSAAAMQPPSRIYELADMLLGVAMPDNEPVLVLDVDRVIPPMATGDVL
jgi:purine-binding chemotaxis protein CheW